MIPLAGSLFPPSHSALHEAIRDGLTQNGLVPREVIVEGGHFPRVDRLLVDLSGTQLSRTQPLPSREVSPPQSPEQLLVEKLELRAAPLYFEGTAIELCLEVRRGVLVPTHDPRSGQLLLSLCAAAEGRITVSALQSELEQLAHRLIKEAAAKQGIDIKKTTLQIEATSARALHFRAEVSAKMFIMNATVAVEGNLEVDSQLNARLSGLSCRGEGMIANAANAFLKPQFQRLENQLFALSAFALPEIPLRDVSVHTGPTVRIEARFGSEA